MSTVVAHLFVCLFAIYISLMVKCLSKFFAHFKIVLLGILLNFESSLCILDLSPLSDKWFAFSPLSIYGMFFPCLNIVFQRSQVLKFDEVYFIFSFVACNFCVASEKYLPFQRSQKVFFFI